MYGRLFLNVLMLFALLGLAGATTEGTGYAKAYTQISAGGTSPYFKPEVGLVNVTVVIHKGLGSYYDKEVEHLVITEVYSNVDQSISLYLRLFNHETYQTISGKTISKRVHVGLNEIWEWLPVNVRGYAIKAQPHAKIISYEQDTDPRNNEICGNIVILRPFLDMYPSIIWKPVKQKIDTAILPGDLIEVSIAYVIPAGGIKDIKLQYNVKSFNLYTRSFEQIESREEYVSTLEPTTIYRNLTIVAPFTNKIVVYASIAHPMEDNALNNEMTLETPVFEDTEITKVEAPPVVKAGEPQKIRVYMKSNAIGYNYRAVVAMEKPYKLIGESRFYITDPEFAVDVVVIPELSRGKPYETQTWTITLLGYDFYGANDEKMITVTVLANNEEKDLIVVWGLPWWIFPLLLAVIVLIVLLLIKK